MRKPKKIHNRLIKSLLISGALIVLVMMIVPQLINLESVRENIENIVSEEIGGEITYRRLDLSYFPRPHVVVYKVEILIPDSFTIKMSRMKVYPKILPLFIGSLQVDVVILEYADYFMRLPQISREVPQSEQIVSFSDIVATISKAIRGLPELKLPELKLKIKYGKINLVDPFGRKFKLREVQAIYKRRPNVLDFSIRCKSNLWDQIDVNGSLDPLNFKGQGRIRLSRFRPQTLIAYLIQDSTLQVTDAGANFAIDVELDGRGNLEAVVDGAVPIFALSRGEEQLKIEGGRIRGTVQIGGKRVGISLTEMSLDYPRLEAGGMFSYDENVHDIQLTLNGSRIDAASVRQVALGLLGESETIRNIFKIIRGGYVPWMTVRTRGHRITELGILNNIVIKGRMTQGKIFIPGAGLDLNDVNGDALISEGILYGENLEAQMGNSIGRDGKMTLGLNAGLTPFQLKIGVNADLSQLPPVLNRTVSDKNFLNELALIRDVKGTATGILVLGDDPASLNAKVEASNIHLTARYGRIPYPVQIDGGHFVYDGTRLALENFKANIGKSSFLRLSIAVDWSGTPGLSVDSQSAEFDLDGFYTWLLSFDAFKKNIRNISKLEGRATVKNLEIKGPFFSPRDWYFQTRGVVNKLVLTSKKLPGSLRIGRGKFTWQGAKITFNGVDAAMGKSSIRKIAGNINWVKTPVFSVRSGRALLYLEDINPLIFSHKNIAAAFDRLKPISGSLVFNRMTVSGPVSQPSYRQVAFSADIKQLMLDSKQLPGLLRVNQGKFSWRKNRIALKEVNASLGSSTISRLSAGFDLGKSSTFEVHSQSVKLIADEVYPWLLSFEKIQPYLKDFSVTKGTVALAALNLNGPFRYPAQWQYDLTADLQNIVLTSDAFGDPVTVNNGSLDMSGETYLEAARNRIRLKAADLIWGENRLRLFGGMILSKNKTLLDLTLSADAIDWNQVKNIVDYVGKNREDPASRLSKRDLLGTLKVQADNFNFETYSARPLEAELSFKPDNVVITINEAVVCSLSFQGRLEFNKQTLEISLVPTAVNQMLAPAVSCLTGQKHLVRGKFNLNGQLRSKSKPDEFLRSLSGTVAFSAEKGRIYRFGILAKILSILNVTEIYRGEVPDLTGEGFAYHSMTVNADLEGGKLIMQECSIDGVSMGIACEGDIDLAQKKMDLIVLVAPFKTVDRIVKFLPLIRHILGGKLISIPFRAKGDLKDPAVTPLHPTAVGSEVLGILERTLKLPITIMQPIFSLGKKNKNDQKANKNPEPSGPP